MVNAFCAVATILFVFFLSAGCHGAYFLAIDRREAFDDRAFGLEPLRAC
jgi:hypothetical protein